MLGLAYAALSAGEGAAIVYNAANEVAVSAFEARRIKYTDIPRVVGGCLEGEWPSRVRELESIFEVDGGARVRAEAAVREIGC
jgi:1-deoxy-D-xylulose-5-phosphate reductoisomerase